jgi:hypothetical protein
MRLITIALENNNQTRPPLKQIRNIIYSHITHLIII